MQTASRAARAAVLLVAAAAPSCVGPSAPTDPFPTESAPDSTLEVVLARDVVWEQLNPARGDQSPGAGTLWGDRKANVPTGYLIRFVDGFSSPPHIHNVSYRGVVLSGTVHNDDPEAARMWMPPGSFWTQPKGEAHITAASGPDCMAYIEIDAGPYLVLPTARAFDSGERPVNLDASNVVWLDASRLRAAPHPHPDPSAGGAEVAFLWGTPRPGRFRGEFLRLPAGFRGRVVSYGSVFRAVVVGGQPSLALPTRTQQETAQQDTMQQNTMQQELELGSYFHASGLRVHRVECPIDQGACTLYVRTNGRYVVLADPTGG